MTDIAERLRDWQDYEPVKMFGGEILKDIREAANEIERLHDSVIDLRALVSDLNAEIERLNAGEAGTDHGRAS